MAKRKPHKFLHCKKCNIDFARTVFWFLFVLALAQPYFMTMMGVSWGAPYQLFSLTVVEEINNSKGIDIGDIVGYVYPDRRDEFIAHEVVAKNNDYLIVEAVIYDDCKQYDFVADDELRLKILSTFKIIKTNDWLLVCSLEMMGDFPNIYESGDYCLNLKKMAEEKQVCQNLDDFLNN